MNPPNYQYTSPNRHYTFTSVYSLWSGLLLKYIVCAMSIETSVEFIIIIIIYLVLFLFASVILAPYAQIRHFLRVFFSLHMPDRVFRWICSYKCDIRCICKPEDVIYFKVAYIAHITYSIPGWPKIKLSKHCLTNLLSISHRNKISFIAGRFNLSSFPMLNKSFISLEYYLCHVKTVIFGHQSFKIVTEFSLQNTLSQDQIFLLIGTCKEMTRVHVISPTRFIF